jgi:hypothetical protein
MKYYIEYNCKHLIISLQIHTHVKIYIFKFLFDIITVITHVKKKKTIFKSVVIIIF